MISYSSVCELVDLPLNGTKVSSALRNTIQNISCVVETLVEEGKQEIPAQCNSNSVFNQVSLALMLPELQKDPVLSLMCQYAAAGNKLKPSGIA